MAHFSGNTPYIALDNVDVSAYWTEGSLEPSNAPTDVTAGSGTTHIERNAGLDDTKLSLTIAYDDASATLASYIGKLKPGNKYTIEIGIEGQVAGKPKHIQEFILESSPVNQSVKKDAVVFKLSFSGSAAPTYNMFAGATY